MKTTVEHLLNETRSELRQLQNSSQRSLSTTAERQKLLVSFIQDYVRHLQDSIRGEYRERILIRKAELRLYNQVMKCFEAFQTMVRIPI
jgi:interferon-induced GTP-binding protein Mx1